MNSEKEKSDQIKVSDEDIAAFRVWMKQDPSLPDEIEDNLIRCHIIYKNGNLHEAKKKFLHFRRALCKEPLLLGPCDPCHEDIIAFNKTTAICYLPKKTPEGYTVMVGKILTSDPAGFSIPLTITQFIYTGFLFALAGDFGNCEVTVVLDVTLAQLAHISTISMQTLSSMIAGFKVNPFRVKSIAVLGLPSFAESFFNIIVQILPKKISERVKCLSRFEELHKIIPKEVLPEDFGGCEVSLMEIYSKQLSEIRLLRDRYTAEGAELRRMREVWDPSLNLANIETFRQLEID